MNSRSLESGFSLVGTMVSMAVVSIVGLALMKLMGSQMKASAAVQMDMDREAVKRSLLQRIDCDASSPGKLPESGVEYIELKAKNSKVLLPASREGTKLGRFHYRASVNSEGELNVESRLLNSSGAVASHPVLGQAKQVDSVTKSKSSKLLLDWSPMFALESPLCSFSKKSGDPSEDTSAELVYLPSGRFKAEGGDLLVEIEYVSDGGFSCKNSLEFSDTNCPLKKVAAVGEKVQFVLKKDQLCFAQVVSTRVEGSGECRGGLINKANGLTAKQGTNQWRVQWEDRLAERGDSEECKKQQERKLPVAAQSACNRLKAVDWNDAIWHIRAQPVKSTKL